MKKMPVRIKMRAPKIVESKKCQVKVMSPHPSLTSAEDNEDGKSLERQDGSRDC